MVKGVLPDTVVGYMTELVMYYVEKRLQPYLSR